MVYINEVKLYDEPGSCGTCPFFYSGASDLSPQQKGHCKLWDEMHKSWRTVPARCRKLFKKALSYQDGERLVIVH